MQRKLAAAAPRSPYSALLMSAITPDQASLAPLRSACGFADFSSAGRLFISGEDSLDLLNRLTTNKLEELPQGQSITTIITNADGRVVDFVALAGLDDGIWCITSPRYAQTVVDWLDSYTFAEDITVVDWTSDTFQFTVAGPTAPAAIAKAVGQRNLAINSALRIDIASVSLVVWHRLAGGAEAFEIVGDLADRDTVFARLVEAGAKPSSIEEWERHRILNGMPVIDAEFGLFNNPLEARLLGSISETKGCYTGQEVLARLITYNKVQRRLMTVDLDSTVALGAKLIASDGKSAGHITSVTETPSGIKGLALVATRLAIDGVALAIDPIGKATLHEPAYALATEPFSE